MLIQTLSRESFDSYFQVLNIQREAAALRDTLVTSMLRYHADITIDEVVLLIEQNTEEWNEFVLKLQLTPPLPWEDFCVAMINQIIEFKNRSTRH